MNVSELLEITMIVCFGASWPFNVIRSYKARTAKGKSLAFLVLILVGYLAGITGKLLGPGYKLCTNHSSKICDLLQMERKEKAVTTLVIGFPGVSYKRTVRREPARVRKL